MVHFWWTVPIATGVLSVLLIFWGKTERGGLVVDKLKITVPVLKLMMRALYINRSLQTLGELINAGVPMLSALEVTGNVSGNKHYKKLWSDTSEGVSSGDKINSVIENTKLLPKPVVQMIAAGEESGRLGDVLEEISEYYDRVLKDAIKTFTSLLEPIMIVCMGCVVGFIAMAIILPIFKMSAVVSG